MYYINAGFVYVCSRDSLFFLSSNILYLLKIEHLLEDPTAEKGCYRHILSLVLSVGTDKGYTPVFLPLHIGMMLSEQNT